MMMKVRLWKSKLTDHWNTFSDQDVNKFLKNKGYKNRNLILILLYKCLIIYRAGKRKCSNHTDVAIYIDYC